MGKEEHSEQIRQLAYEIWEREGRPEGKESEHWQQAEREIRERMAGNSAGREEEPVGNEKRSRWPGAAPTTASKPKRTTTTRKKRSTEK